MSYILLLLLLLSLYLSFHPRARSTGTDRDTVTYHEMDILVQAHMHHLFDICYSTSYRLFDQDMLYVDRDGCDYECGIASLTNVCRHTYLPTYIPCHVEPLLSPILFVEQWAGGYRRLGHPDVSALLRTLRELQALLQRQLEPIY